MPLPFSLSSLNLRVYQVFATAVMFLLLITMLGGGSPQAQPATLPGDVKPQQAGVASGTQANSNERVTNAPPAQTEAAPQSVGTEDAPRAYITYKTPYEFFLTGITVALAVFMATLLSVMGWKSGITEEFLRSFLVLIVVFAALFLIVAGYSEKQTAPVFGLLGTIVGYMFGRMSSAPGSPRSEGIMDRVGDSFGSVRPQGTAPTNVVEGKRAGSYPL